MIALLLAVALGISDYSWIHWVASGPERCHYMNIVSESGEWIEQEASHPCQKPIGKSNGYRMNRALIGANKAATNTLEACFRANGDELFCFPIYRGKGGV